MYNEEMILQQAEVHDSFYLYEEAKIKLAMENLQKNFKGIRFLYSIKTNANKHVVQSVLSNGFGVDAASVAEVEMGVSHGVDKRDIQYSTPGKTRKYIEKTLECATIVADSLGEMVRIQEVAEAKGVVAEIGVRLNPDFSFYGDTGVASKFGIDEEAFFNHLDWILSLNNIKIIGLHIHIRSQELDEMRIATYYENILRLAHTVQRELGTNLAFINMGSGIGIPYEIDDTALDMQKLGGKTLDIVASFAAEFPQTQLYIETGRYVVGKSGVYVTKVLDKKVSYGTTYVVLGNTLNGFLRPSIAQLIVKYSGVANPVGSEPLYTTKNPTQIHVLKKETEMEVVTLVGNLCTATDVVATDILLPKLEEDDIVVMTNAGSYAAVLSPMQFSSQIPPKELFLQENGEVIF
ncbi:diaminopimelate decarboxylase [Chakrabartyella piscis]|uniref:diaminopimelate decarboxylase n=1 Tax=Chakrabartyella piscis TaxID=2918914 RepID=UPI002958A40D|nr:diaminopimelate decarboxylase [Chakrabartyella piscis]